MRSPGARCWGQETLVPARAFEIRIRIENEAMIFLLVGDSSCGGQGWVRDMKVGIKRAWPPNNPQTER